MPDNPGKRSVYRQQSLEKFSSPDRLDELTRIVRPSGWMALGTALLGLALTLLWGFMGRIPTTVSGNAILLLPRQVITFQSPARGEVAALLISEGDRVEPGQVLARLRLPALETQRDLEQLRLQQFRARDTRLTQAERELAESELEFLGHLREDTQRRIDRTTESADRQKLRNEEYLSQQRINLQTGVTLNEDLHEKLERRFEARQKLAIEQLISIETLLETTIRLMDNELQRAQLEVDQYELELKRNESLDTYEQRMDIVQDLQVQLGNMTLRELTVKRRLLEDQLQSEDELQGLERRIAELEERLEYEGRILYDGTHPGRVLEMSALVGQRVELGDRLGRIEVDDPEADVVALAYFTVGDGKKIVPNQVVRLCPSTVERERHGSLLGRVVEAKRYPVTSDVAASRLGDADLARSLLGGRSCIEVLIRLKRDASTESGFAWTSRKGPTGVPITAGTTAEARVTLERRAPITFVLPFLRSSLGS